MRVLRLVENRLSIRQRYYLGFALALLLLAGCAGQRMVQQAKVEPLEASTFFEDGRASRDLVPNTVARGLARTDTHLYAGVVDGAPATSYPFAITPAVLERGRERYAIFCTPCHGYAGYGDGIVVQRGLTPPPSLHDERLRQAPPGYLFNVITKGFGAMYSYGDRVPPDDRWAIIAYIQALQLSQNATIEEVPAEERQRLNEATQ